MAWDTIIAGMSAEFAEIIPLAIAAGVAVAVALIGFGLVFKFLRKGGASK